MTGLKTSVLIAASLKIGAIIGGADHQSAENIYNFGYNLGLAFQLQDDFLDSYGTENVFGKKIGNDIITNKKTYLYLKSLSLASPEDRRTLITLYSSEQKNPREKITLVKEIFNRVNVKSHSQIIIDEYFKQALHCLGNVKVKRDRKKILEEFTLTLGRRIK